MNAALPVLPAADPLCIELAEKSRPPQRWLYSSGAHQPEADPLARDVAALWRPTQAIEPKALQPGNAGLASYRLPYFDGDKHLKLVMPMPKEQAADYQKLCVATVGEPSRAAWAGALDIGPAVHFCHPALGAFISDFVPGRVATREESRGALLPLHLQALGRLHRQDVQGVPPGGNVDWLSQPYNSVEKKLAAAKEPRPAALQHALVQLERGVDFFFSRQPSYLPAPIHDDYKPNNAFFDGEKLVVLDWANLRIADPAVDLGHLACMVDVPAAKLGQDVVGPYAAYQRAAGVDARDDSELLDAKLAYTCFFRLRALAFNDQWTSSRGTADYLRHQLIDDVAAMQASIFAQSGLRADLGGKRG